MAHRSHLAAVVIDVPEDRVETTTNFWGAALGRPLRQLDHDEFWGVRVSTAMVLLVQRLGEGAPRVHIDIHTDDVPAEVARLEALGAVVASSFAQWTVMTDPSGQPFCVVEAPPGTLEGDDVIEWS
ncbi:MAG: VOC family protein [Acidimicrobiales bacterium]